MDTRIKTMNKEELVSLCITVREKLPKMEMVLFKEDKSSNIYQQIRVNPFSPSHSNIVRHESGEYIMETGVFGKDVLSLVKLLKNDCGNRFEYRDATWFYVPKGNIVPIHIDENYGGIIRNKIFATFAITDKDSWISIDHIIYPLIYVEFCPTMQPHGAHSINEDLWIIQLPLRSNNEV